MPLKSIKGSAYPYASNRTVTTNRRGIQRGGSLVYHQTWVDPTAKVTNGITTATAGPNTTTANLPINGSLASGGKATLLPLFGPFTGGRNVVITVTHGSSVVAVSGVITGLDVYGVRITEAWSVTAGGTSKTYTGLKAFKVITGITVTAAADATTDTIIAGDGDVLGLDVICSVGGTGAALKEIVASALVVTGVIVASGFTMPNGVITISSTADLRGTYAPATIPNGTNDYDLWYISDMPEFSGGA